VPKFATSSFKLQRRHRFFFFSSLYIAAVELSCAGKFISTKPPLVSYSWPQLHNALAHFLNPLSPPNSTRVAGAAVFFSAASSSAAEVGPPWPSHSGEPLTLTFYAFDFP
jgi:hypothetical protein